MGQCKSKFKPLDAESLEQARENKDERAKKSAKKKWRKSRGYSFSENGDENLRKFAKECGNLQQTQGTSNSAVLVSYNVTEQRSGGRDDVAASARNSSSNSGSLRSAVHRLPEAGGGQDGAPAPAIFAPETVHPHSEKSDGNKNESGGNLSDVDSNIRSVQPLQHSTGQPHSSLHPSPSLQGYRAGEPDNTSCDEGGGGDVSGPPPPRLGPPAQQPGRADLSLPGSNSCDKVPYNHDRDCQNTVQVNQLSQTMPDVIVNTIRSEVASASDQVESNRNSIRESNAYVETESIVSSQLRKREKLSEEGDNENNSPDTNILREAHQNEYEVSTKVKAHPVNDPHLRDDVKNSIFGVQLQSSVINSESSVPLQNDRLHENSTKDANSEIVRNTIDPGKDELKNSLCPESKSIKVPTKIHAPKENILNIIDTECSDATSPDVSNQDDKRKSFTKRLADELSTERDSKCDDHERSSSKATHKLSIKDKRFNFKSPSAVHEEKCRPPEIVAAAAADMTDETRPTESMDHAQGEKGVVKHELETSAGSDLTNEDKCIPLIDSQLVCKTGGAQNGKVKVSEVINRFEPGAKLKVESVRREDDLHHKMRCEEKKKKSVDNKENMSKGDAGMKGQTNVFSQERIERKDSSKQHINAAVESKKNVGKNSDDQISNKEMSSVSKKIDLHLKAGLEIQEYPSKIDYSSNEIDDWELQKGLSKETDTELISDLKPIDFKHSQKTMKSKDEILTKDCPVEGGRKLNNTQTTDIKTLKSIEEELKKKETSYSDQEQIQNLKNKGLYERESEILKKNINLGNDATVSKTMGNESYISEMTNSAKHSDLDVEQTVRMGGAHKTIEKKESSRSETDFHENVLEDELVSKKLNITINEDNANDPNYKDIRTPYLDAFQSKAKISRLEDEKLPKFSTTDVSHTTSNEFSDSINLENSNNDYFSKKTKEMVNMTVQAISANDGKSSMYYSQGESKSFGLSEDERIENIEKDPISNKMRESPVNVQDVEMESSQLKNEMKSSEMRLTQCEKDVLEESDLSYSSNDTKPKELVKDVRMSETENSNVKDENISKLGAEHRIDNPELSHMKTEGEFEGSILSERRPDDGVDDSEYLHSKDEEKPSELKISQMSTEDRLNEMESLYLKNEGKPMVPHISHMTTVDRLNEMESLYLKNEKKIDEIRSSHDIKDDSVHKLESSQIDNDINCRELRLSESDLDNIDVKSSNLKPESVIGNKEIERNSGSKKRVNKKSANLSGHENPPNIVYCPVVKESNRNLPNLPSPRLADNLTDIQTELNQRNTVGHVTRSVSFTAAAPLRIGDDPPGPIVFDSRYGEKTDCYPWNPMSRVPGGGMTRDPGGGTTCAVCKPEPSTFHVSASCRCTQSADIRYLDAHTATPRDLVHLDSRGLGGISRDSSASDAFSPRSRYSASELHTFRRSEDTSTTSSSSKGEETDTGEEGCYDSLEDLKRGQGLRKLPTLPTSANDSLEDLSWMSEDSRSGGGLSRSKTFVSATRTATHRRRLPEIPVRRNDTWKVTDKPTTSSEHQSDVGFFSLSDERSPEMDTDCPSLDCMGEETSVDSVPTDKPGPASYLWVDFDEGKNPVKRRPKNHDRLVQIAQARHRHSAPPGSLTGSYSTPQQKRSLPEKPSFGGKKRSYSRDRRETTGSGRIHSAVVSGINVETKSVTVEWFERGETKGKEIELEQILDLNQDLAPQAYDTNPIPNKLQKNENKQFGETKSYVPRPSIPVAGRGRNKNAVRRSEVIASNGHAKEDASEAAMPPPKQVPSLPPEKSETVSKATGAAAKTQTGDRRRSNVVKEVERLKENREKRRAQQAQILEEKEALRNIDPGNPNWEFLQMILDYKDQLEFNPLKEGDPINDHQITVCVRKRPQSQKEIKRKEIDVVTCPNKDQVIIHEPKTKVDLTKYLDSQHFRFDYAFDEGASNELVYKYTARPLVQCIFDGGMATCFAYGQTGSGKTHTMGGEFQGKTQDSKGGIYAFATRDVFKLHKSPKYKNLNIHVCCSYFEIYSGKVFDLLSGKSKLRVLEDGKQQVVIVGLTEREVDCVEDVLKLITHGNNLRTSGQTSANAHSSRSHAVFQIILRNSNNKKSLYGKFSLIDLAGNERGADTSSANRQTRMEGAEINKSLLALKECIRALGRKGAHLPFRASKLTQVLRDSFIGEKARTCMIAMISPSMSSCEHTLNTLRYADRVKELGAADPVEQRGKQINTDLGEYEEDETLSARMDDGVMSPEDSDLAQLRSLNDGECSADWYNFQESVAHLQLLEEEVVESHRNLVENMNKWIAQDSSLLVMSNEVDYDQDAYAQQLEDMIAEKQEALAELREKTRAFRECLNEEELRSKNLVLRRN